MSEKRDDAITRRRVLELAGVAGTAMFLRPAVAQSAPADAQPAAVGTPVACVTPSTSGLPFMSFIDGMAGTTKVHHDNRVCFDRNAVGTLSGYGVNGEQWQTFMRMKAGDIKNAVNAEIDRVITDTNAATAVKNSFKLTFEAFATPGGWPCKGA